MHQSQFESHNGSRWDLFEKQLAGLESKKRSSDKKGLDLAGFPESYRKICNHYALAQSRHYSPALVGRLHQLVLRGHQQLYRSNRTWFWPSISFIGRGFPVAVRRHAVPFWIALFLFYFPALVCGYLAYTDPVMIYSVMDERQVAAMEYMYDPQNRKPGRSMERTSETDFQMFGYYILHNISIGFRTFAGGMFMGLGTVFYLFYNGLLLGGVAGHLSHAPFAGVFWPFVAGHGAFELTAIVISGAAGLVLARALLMPGSFSRRTALRLAAPGALQLVMGAALMLVIAAFVEAFWSPSSFSAQIRFGVAAVNWILVITYLIWGGRRYGS